MRQVNRYTDIDVKTVDGGRLIIMLYDGAIRFLKEAAVACRKRDFKKKGTLIGRAERIVGELQACLNFEVGGEICKNLDQLYSWMILHLTEANLKTSAEHCERVVSILSTLRDAWETAVNQLRQEKAADPGLDAR